MEQHEEELLADAAAAAASGTASTTVPSPVLCQGDLLPAPILKALELHQAEAERWLVRHHARLRSSIQACLPTTLPTESVANEVFTTPDWAPRAPVPTPPPALSVDTTETISESPSTAVVGTPRRLRRKTAMAFTEVATSQAEAEPDDYDDLFEVEQQQQQQEQQQQQQRLRRLPTNTSSYHDQQQQGLRRLPTNTSSYHDLPTRGTSRSSSKLRIGQVMGLESRGERAKSRFLQVMTDSDQNSQYKPGTMRAKLDVLLQGHFDMGIGFLIILNTIVMFVELEVEGQRLPNLEVGSDTNSTQRAYDQIVNEEQHIVFAVFKHTFNVIFALELALKLFVYRRHFWHTYFNTLDAAIVFASIADTYVLSQVGNEFATVSIVRLVRFARLVRVLRVIRTLNLFGQLRVLLNTIAMSFMSLIWSMVVLFVFMLTSSLLLCQMLQDAITDHTSPDKVREWVQHHYGTSTRSLYTVFELTFSGCWPNYARTLIDDVSSGYAVFFALYVTGVIFAMVRIISALFLKDTLQAASNDADIIVQEKVKEIRSFVSKLSDLFKEADRNSDGFLTMDELKQVLAYPKVKLWMSVVGLDVSDATAIFQTLDDGDGRVSRDEFVNGIMRLKGNSRSQDTVLIMRDCDRIIRQCRSTRLACESLREVLLSQALYSSTSPLDPCYTEEKCIAKESVGSMSI